MIEYENLAKLNKPFADRYLNAFSSTLSGGSFIMGQQVSGFETAFASYCGARYAVGVASGLDALILSLRAYDFKPGSEIIVPANTYIATILAVLHAGLKPVLVEPDIRTYNLDASLLRDAITSKTVALLAVHLYGKCCNMEAIGSICSQYDLRIIEDGAQAHGAMFKKQKAGSLGHVAAFSFYPTKNLGALGDGGCVVTNDESIFDRVRALRNYGSLRKYENDYIGLNSRLDEIQAAFLSVKLENLDQINDHKRSLARIYLDGLSDNFVVPVEQEHYHDVYHIFTVRHPQRDKLRAYLLDNGIQTEVHYPIPPHKQRALQGVLDVGKLVLTEEIHNTTLSLPISAIHDAAEISRVVEVMNRF